MLQTHIQPKNINTDKSYLLGLIIGGGEISGSRLTIRLPYRNWGDLKINPERGGEISEYIIRVVKPMWQNEYSMNIDYAVLNNSWAISGDVTENLIKDLSELGLPVRGDFKENSNIEKLVISFNNDDKIKRFIAGLTDTIGSLAASHRHRTARFQIISFEIAGKNFTLVSQLIKLFIAIDCYPNQVLWNHPNFHSGVDRYYKSWKKGFKLRIALADYMLKGSFVSEAKKLSASINMTVQGAATHESTEMVRINGSSTLHMDENSQWLPENIRGKHFIHHTHMGYLLGVPTNAQALNYLRQKIEVIGSLISPFTILTKGERSEIQNIIASEPYLAASKYTEIAVQPGFISNALKDPLCAHVFGPDNERGFPINQVMHALMYVALAQKGEGGLKGKRILGDRFEKFIEIEPELSHLGVRIMKPDRGTCLLIETNEYAALVGYADTDFNATLIDADKESLIIRAREPNYSECVIL